MNKKIIVTAFLLAAGLFATRNAQAQRTYEEMERLTVNEQVTTVITATAPLCPTASLAKPIAIGNTVPPKSPIIIKPETSFFFCGIASNA